jgi:hypothetical protein
MEYLQTGAVQEVDAMVEALRAYSNQQVVA